VDISKHEFDILRDYIRTHCGISVGDEKNYLIESRLTQLVIENGCRGFEEFYHKAKNDPRGALRDKIVDAITTNETSWFRDGAIWTAIKEAIIPGLIATLTAGRKPKIRIWSAACSTGQEPYTLAMLIDEALSLPAHSKIQADQFEIVATDISPSALFLAISGRYNQIAMSRGLPESYRNRYFTLTDSVWLISPTLKQRVTFKKFNLQDPFTSLGLFDVVFCRNVAIYFSPTFKTDLFNRIAKVLTPCGVFVLGASESLLGYSAAFDLVEYKKIIYYRSKSRVL